MQTVEPPSAGSQNKSPHAPGNRRHDTMHRSSISLQQKTKPPEPVSCPLTLWDLAVQFISCKYSRFCIKKRKVKRRWVIGRAICGYRKQQKMKWGVRTTWRSADSGCEVRNAAPANLMQLIWYIGWTLGYVTVYSADLFVTNIMRISPVSKNHLKPAFKLYSFFCSSRTFSNAIFFKTQKKNALWKLNYAQTLDWIATVNTVMFQEKSGDFLYIFLDPESFIHLSI